MGFLVLVIGFLVWFYFIVYQRWGYYGKFVFKSIILTYVLLHTSVIIGLMIAVIPDVYEEQKNNRVSSRLEDVQKTMNKGDYCEVANEMDLYENYESEFDYVWERLKLYACLKQYQIYDGALENVPESAEYEIGLNKYGNMLMDLSSHLEFEENQIYADYYLEEAELKK